MSKNNPTHAPGKPDIDIEAELKGFDIYEYYRALEHEHAIFYALMSIAKPEFTESIPTACVGYNTDDHKVYMLINPYFFFSLERHQRLYLLCHEALHLLYNHLKRTMTQKNDPYRSNVAQDIVINEVLVSNYSFSKNDTTENFEPLYIDTVFTQAQINKHNIKSGKSFEYYYEILEILDKKKLEKLSGGAGSIDEHQPPTGGAVPGSPMYGDMPQEVADELSERVAEKLTESEKKELNATLGRGDQPGGNLFPISSEAVAPVKTWEDIVKNKVASLLKREDKFIETFIERDRRLVNMDKDMFVPMIKDLEHKKNDKYVLAFFLDTSGSCISYANKFFRLAKTIPEKMFDVHLYCFDTRVYKTDIASGKAYGGGGTSFDIIESAIQRDFVSNSDAGNRYPDLVFLLTDGYGNTVRPEKPKNWFWILTASHSTHYIHKESTKILMSKFDR